MNFLDKHKLHDDNVDCDAEVSLSVTNHNRNLMFNLFALSSSKLVCIHFSHYLFNILWNDYLMAVRRKHWLNSLWYTGNSGNNLCPLGNTHRVPSCQPALWKSLLSIRSGENNWPGTSWLSQGALTLGPVAPYWADPCPSLPCTHITFLYEIHVHMWRTNYWLLLNF